MDNRRIKRKFMASMQPRQMVLELLDKGALRIRQAQEAIGRRDCEAANSALLDAQAIFGELRAMLRHPDARTERADAFLGAVETQLVRANLKKDAAPLREIMPLIIRLQMICSSGQAEK